MPDALLPLFPLGLVLFPRTSLPLHIFEERYKVMINECLEGDREFGVVLTLEKGIASVGCTARINTVTKTYDDGRMDIETTGYRRFEIAELNEEQPYLSAEITYFDDDFDPAPQPDALIHKAIAGYYALRALKSGEDLPDPKLNDHQLSFQLAQAVTDVHIRQTLLMSRSEAARIKRLAEYFPLTAARERRKEHFRTLVPRNGHARLLPQFMTRQHLIIDADDTLWENNIFFEKAFDEFVEFLDHSHLTPPQVRDVLDAIEAVNAKIHGYGSKNFGKNLIQTYEKLAQRQIAAEDLDTIIGFAERILDHPIILRPGVGETLGYLHERHELTLFTKGHPDEQRMKIDRSELARYFHHAEIVKEKDVAAYLNLGAAKGFHPPNTWMIGNSPKSDINPALAAGYNAVFLPHPRTWILEREELAQPQAPAQLFVLDHFGELREYF